MLVIVVLIRNVDIFEVFINFFFEVEFDIFFSKNFLLIKVVDSYWIFIMCWGFRRNGCLFLERIFVRKF